MSTDSTVKPRVLRSSEDPSIYWVFKPDSADWAVGYVEKFITERGVHWSPFYRKTDDAGLHATFQYVLRNFPTLREAAAFLMYEWPEWVAGAPRPEGWPE